MQTSILEIYQKDMYLGTNCYEPFKPDYEIHEIQTEQCYIKFIVLINI